MSAEHSPHRLMLDPEDLTSLWEDPSAGSRVAQCFPGLNCTDLRVAIANARRIVTCWNACIGLPSEALDAGLIARALEYMDPAWGRGESVAQPFNPATDTLREEVILSVAPAGNGGHRERTAADLTAREYAILQALIGLLAGKTVTRKTSVAEIARRCREIADAVLGGG
jgi:hypothetical protein